MKVRTQARVAILFVVVLMLGVMAWLAAVAIRQGSLDQALIEAVRADDTTAAANLLARGADPNTRLHRRNILMSLLHPLPTALCLASRRDARMVTLLLDGHADVNARMDEGRTPLMEAAMYGDPRIVQVLLERRADVNARDAGDWTALLYAVEEGDARSVRVLLNHGADVRARTVFGKTALSLTTSIPITEMLQQAGARP